MESLREIFRIGNGPSSSHTMGPKHAAELFLNRIKEIKSDHINVTLYGSLAATGRGHLTDKAILSILAPVFRTEILWCPEIVLPYHPNGVKFEALDKNDTLLYSWTAYSVGGGALFWEGKEEKAKEQVYDMNTISEIKRWGYSEGRTFWEYVDLCEGPSIWEHLDEVWRVMSNAIKRGLNTEGVLPGELKVARKATKYFVKSDSYVGGLSSRAKIYSYALATAEENASGGLVATAPTCGSCGVLPAVIYHLQQSRNFSRERILHALATAGLFANVVKSNASIAGAEVGCQGEVGVACAMAAAAANQMFGGTLNQIEYAAEMGLEHHLGLTCDPMCGLVQIPCIERNAIASARAFDVNFYSMLSDGIHRVSFDRVVEVMKETGHDIPSLYRETSEGGLAKYSTDSIQ